MLELYGRPVFRAAGRLFYWEDVLLTAAARGRWAEFERRTREGLACVAYYEALESELEEPEDLIEEAGQEFRYERELITAQEMEQWLADREIPTTEWLEHIRRGVLHSEVGQRLEDLLLRYPVAEEPLANALRVDFLCSGMAGTSTDELAETAAAAVAFGAWEGLTPVPTGLPPLPPGLPVARAAERWPLLRQLEEGAEQFRRSVLTPAAILKEIGGNQMEWLLLECQSLVFPDEAQAREAALCIRDDGIPIEEVAAAAHAPVAESRFYLDQLEPAVRLAFLSARAGEIIGPVPAEQEFTLYRVIRKENPTERDPAIRERAEAGILRRALGDEFRRRIEWEVGN